MKITTPLIAGGIAGAILGDIIPTPGDAVSFHLFKKNRDAWAKGEITAKQYWLRENLAYYLPNAIWWGLVGVIVFNTGKDTESKLKILLGLVGGFAVVTLVMKHVYDDERLGLAELNAQAHELLKKEQDGKL
jgi:hypothetical protein